MAGVMSPIPSSRRWRSWFRTAGKWNGRKLPGRSWVRGHSPFPCIIVLPYMGRFFHKVNNNQPVHLNFPPFPLTCFPLYIMCTPIYIHICKPIWVNSIICEITVYPKFRRLTLALVPPQMGKI